MSTRLVVVISGPLRLATLGTSPVNGGGWGAVNPPPFTGEVSAKRTEGASPALLRHRRDRAPDFLGDLDHQADLFGLLLGGDVVAVDRRGEAALRTQRELVDVDELRRLVDPALDVVLALELAELGGDEAEHHRLALGQEPQRGEVARARVVVLEEERVDIELVEHDLGDGLVAAFGGPARAEVAAAQVDRLDHVGGRRLEALVDQLGVLPGVSFGSTPRAAASAR